MATDSGVPVIAVSADTHVGPLLDRQLRDYCPSKYLDEFDAFAATHAAIAGEFDGTATDEAGAISCSRKETGNSTPSHYEFAARLVSSNRAGADRAERFRRNLGPRHHDVHARMAEMNRDGVASEVIFHGSQNGEMFPFIGGQAFFFDPTVSASELERVAVGMHIYNQWLADWCSTEPERHVGLVHLPLWDIDLALKELRWAKDAGLRGVNFPAPRPGIASYDEQAWEPFWATAEALHMPLTTHGGVGDFSTWAQSPIGGLLLTMEAGGWPCRRGLQRMIFSGVFERHPELKLVYTELTQQPSTWWPGTVTEFDDLYIRRRWQVEGTCPRPPSEYFRTNVFIGASFLHRAPREIPLSVEHGYDSNMMWGSDYPHIEGTLVGPQDENDPSTTRIAMRYEFAGVSEDVTRRILGENAIKLYGLDARILGEVAKRIDAPTPADLRTPLPAGALPDYWNGAD